MFLVAALLLFYANYAHANEVRTTNFTFGCRIEQDAKRMFDLAAKDTTAVAKFLFDKVAIGLCEELAEGTIVEIERTSQEARCVRPRGEPYCYWVPNGWLAGVPVAE